MNTRLKFLAVCSGLIGIYALATLPMLRAFPPPWPDETEFSSPAAALARGQGMGTDVLAGFLPGIDRYLYWHPPGYFFLLSFVFRLVSPPHHFIAMRLFSWFLGLVVLLLSADTLRRLAVDAGGVFLSLVVMGTQVSFIEVANVGRMEMLTLVSALAALNCYLAYRKRQRWRLLAIAGVLAGFAMLSHPAGILAPAVMIVHEVAAPERRGSWAKDFCVFLGSILAAFLPWFVYIAQAPRLFAAQMLAQSARKSSALGELLTSGGYASWLFHPFQNAIWPLGHPVRGIWPFTPGTAVLIQFLMLVVGLTALLAEGRRRVEASLLGTWALGACAVNLFLTEMWYGVHLTAACCLMLGWATAASRKWARTLALVLLVLAASLNVEVVKLLCHISQDGSKRYALYCAILAQKIPPHSSVLLAAIPDPYFGWFKENKPYRVYEFVPEGMTVDESQAKKALSKIDYVVGSACCRPDYLMDYLVAHGRAEANMGRWSFASSPITLWRLHGRQESQPKKKEKSQNAW